MKNYVLFLSLALFSVTAFAGAAEKFDSPQWQGPDRNAISKENGLLKEWPKEGPALAWKVKELGGGYSAPAIAAGRIFGMSNKAEKEIVWALSETDGKPLWEMPIGSAFEQKSPQGAEGPACTPTVDGKLLYVLGLGGELACLQVSDGKIVWHHNLMTEFGGRAPMWSYRESPLVDGDKVICTPGSDDATMIAFDKLTGKTIWKAKLPESAGSNAGGSSGQGGGQGRQGGGGRGGMGGGSGAGYASAIAIDFEGQRQYVQFTAKALAGFAASDGKFLWRYDKPANRMGINCSTPIYEDGKVFAASAYNTGGGLVKLTKEADGGIKAEEVFFTKKMQNQHGGMVVVDGYLYGANGGNEGGYLVCIDFKTGDVKWDERNGESKTPKGALTFADGRIYYRTEKGVVLLIEPNPEKYVERGRFEQPDRSDKPDWTRPVIANGKLYLRDQDVMQCYDIKAK